MLQIQILFAKYLCHGNILTTSILNSFKTLGIILGYTIIFSLIPSILFARLNTSETIKGIVIGIFELTNGIKILSNTNLNTTTLLCIASFILSFSSLMIIFQIHTFILNTNVHIKTLVVYKLMHGIVSSIVTYILLKLNVFNIQITRPTSLDLSISSTAPLTLNTMYTLIILITILLLYLTLKKK